MTPSPIPEPKPEEREELARIIDPEMWSKIDQHRREGEPEGVLAIWAAPSLAKADAILSAGYQRHEQGWKVGEAVVVDAPDVGQFDATIVEPVEGWWRVRFRDGSTATRPPSQIRPSPPNTGEA